MLNLGLRTVLALALVLWLGTPPVFAGYLVGVHLTRFDLQADQTKLHVGDRVHLTITAQTSEYINNLEGVSLPFPPSFDIEADERHTIRKNQGAEYVEKLTLRSTRPGTFRVFPATLEAIDLNTERPSLFSTNSLEVKVLPVGPEALAGLVSSRVLKIVAVIVVFAGILIVIIRRRKPRPTGVVTRVEAAPQPIPGVPASTMVPRIDLEDPVLVRDLIAQLTNAPSRKRVILFRDMLRLRAGARDNETFGDLASRHAQTEFTVLVNALRGLERAAFITDDHFIGAVSDCLGPLLSYAAWLEARRR